ncbi:MAG: E3 ubiquitin ligase family protein [Armatimonadetes bacterium]|nr:E3 ubiquitin ligase family protein [Armatimonadota bacterium]
MLLAGVLLLLLGIILVFVYRSQQRKLGDIAGTETTTVAALRSLLEDFRQRGGGAFQYQAELKGTIECESPLTSELAGEKCVHYRLRVEREWEEDYWETDSRSGRREQRTRRGSDTVSSNERSLPFLLRDGTGAIHVDPAGADIETVQVMDRYEPGSPSGGVLSLGGFQISIGLPGGGRRTLGHRFQEWVTPVGRSAYVLGPVREREGELILARLPEGGRRFLVCLRSEEEMVRSLRSALMGLRAGIVIALLAGIGLLVAGLAHR